MISFLIRTLMTLGAAALALAGFAAYRLNHTPRRDLLDEYFISPFELGVPYREVSFWTEDQHELRGWFLENKNSDSILVGLTGRQVAKDSLIGIGTGLWRAGFNVLIFDFRGRGQSDPGHQTVGYTEARDTRAAVEFALRLAPGARPGLFGFSMGGALAILQGAEDERIQAIMTDCAFASLEDTLAAAFARMRLPGRPLARLTNWINRLAYGYDLRAVEPIDAIDKIQRPIYLIHAGDDRTIPREHHDRLLAAGGSQVESWIVEGCDHCGAYFKDREEYIRRVGDFFNRAMPAD